MKSTKFLFTFLLAACWLAQPAAAKGHDVLTDMFAWWNSAYASQKGFTEADFARYYTKDAAIYMNGETRAIGIPAITRHFQKMRSEAEKIVVYLPFEEEFRSGDRIFTHHLIATVADGKAECWHVMGFATLKADKIAALNFVSVAEPASGPHKPAVSACLQKPAP